MAWRYVLAATLLADPAVGWDTPDSLYFTGIGAEVLIANGSVRADGSRFACSGCHGADGRGAGEGATLIPPVTWAALTAATKARPAYDAESLAQAVRSGFGSDGQPLSSAMPRYQMDDAAMAGLVESLKNLEANDRLAFGPQELRVRVRVDDPRLRGFADAAQAFNDAGGAYGRSIVVVDARDALALNDIVGSALGGMASSAEALLFDQIAADGHRHIRWLTPLPPAERDFRLRQLGLVHDDTSRILLWTSESALPPSLTGIDAVYADLASAAPFLAALIDGSVQLYLAAPDGELLAAALHDSAPLSYVEGYLAALALGQALTEAGRAGGQEALRRALARTGTALPISVHRIDG